MAGESGSCRKTSAIATATSGAPPTVTEVRDAPTSPTASVKRICERPGASRPASRKGHAPCRSKCNAAAIRDTPSAGRTVASVAPLASASPRSAMRKATVIPPKSAAEASAKPTAVIALRPEPRALSRSTCRVAPRDLCEPAAADQRRERPDDAPVAKKRSSGRSIDSLDPRLRRQPLAVGAEVGHDPYLADPGARERVDAAAGAPRCPGRAEDDLTLGARELAQPEGAKSLADRPSDPEPAQALAAPARWGLPRSASRARGRARVPARAAGRPSAPRARRSAAERRRSRAWRRFNPIAGPGPKRTCLGDCPQDMS